MFLLWGKHIRKYYLKYFIFFLIGVASLIMVDYFQLVIPEVLGDLVDELNNNGTIDVESTFFREIMIKVLVVSAIMFAGRVLWRVSLLFASHKIEEKMRYEMFLKAERLDLSFYHSTKIGNIMNWCTTDIETIQEFLGWGTLMMVDGIFLTSIALAKMFMLNYTIALFILIPISLIVVWGAICESRMGAIWKYRQEKDDSIYDFTQENFTGIRVIKAFVKEQQQIRAFSKIAKECQQANVKFTFVSILFDVIIEIIIAIVNSLIIGLGGFIVYRTVTGNPFDLNGNIIALSPGELVKFFGYYSSLIWPLIALGQVVTMFSQARASYKRIAHFLDAPEDIFDKEDAQEVQIEGSIKFDNFSFKYPDGDFDCLNNISLTINKGERIGIVGTVGSGKSTLVSVLVRLFNVKENTLFIDGVDIMKIKIDCLRKGVSIAPQDNFLFSDTIKNNIAFASDDFAMEDIESAARFASIEEDILGFEAGYDTLMGENGHTVSGGQKQRISLARAYLKDSPILILDDSVSAVDLKTEESILNNINEHRKGKTTIIIASRISTVIDLDKVIVLNKGHLEAFDTPKNLLKTSDTFSRLYALQELEKEKGGIVTNE